MHNQLIKGDETEVLHNLNLLINSWTVNYTVFTALITLLLNFIDGYKLEKKSLSKLVTSFFLIQSYSIT